MRGGLGKGVGGCLDFEGRCWGEDGIMEKDNGRLCEGRTEGGAYIGAGRFGLGFMIGLSSELSEL
jgi:hypothetical protein